MNNYIVLFNIRMKSTIYLVLILTFILISCSDNNKSKDTVHLNKLMKNVVSSYVDVRKTKPVDYFGKVVSISIHSYGDTTDVDIFDGYPTLTDSKHYPELNPSYRYLGMVLYNGYSIYFVEYIPHDNVLVEPISNTKIPEEILEYNKYLYSNTESKNGFKIYNSDPRGEFVRHWNLYIVKNKVIKYSPFPFYEM